MSDMSSKLVSRLKTPVCAVGGGLIARLFSEVSLWTLGPRFLLCRPNLPDFDEAVYDRSSLGEGSEALIVEALSTEATLVSRSLLLSEVSEGVVFVDCVLVFFGSSGKGRAGSTLVLMGSGCGECLSFRDLVNLENNDFFSGCAGSSFLDDDAGLALRFRAVVELIGVLF